RNRAVKPEAYEAYLKGRYFLNNLTEESLRKAIGYFEQAIHLDATNAEAYALLAMSWHHLEYIGAEETDDVLPKVLEAATKAQQIDGSIADVHLAAGNVAELKWDWINAEKEVRTAIKLNSGLVLAHTNLGDELRHRGRREESIGEAKRALELDPLSPSTYE